MAEKKFVKGLFKDTAHIDQPEGSWRYALNAFLNDKNGSVSNEGGTWPDGILPDADTPFHATWTDAEYFAVIGTINVNEDRVVLFLKDTRSETTSFYPQSMIVIWEGLEKQTPGYTNGIKILFSDYQIWSNNLKPLNFGLKYRIEGTFKIDSRQDLIIYWTDDLNPPRAFNISRQERAFGTGFIGYYRIYGIVVPGPHFDHIDLLNLFPNSGPVPHIGFFTIYDNAELDNGDQQSVIHGGGLLTGVYYLALAYTDVDFVSTNFLTVSNPVSITTEYDHSRPTFRKDGNKDGSQTSKAINWSVSNLNTDYKYLKPVVIRKMGDAVDAYRLSDIDVTIASTEGVVFSGIEGFVKSSVSDVIIDTASYDTAKTVNQLDGVLYLGNLTGTKDLGYQKYANNIKLTAITKEIENFDEFWATTDNLETGFNTMEVDDGNYVDDSKSYRFDTNIFRYKGYMRDEIYAFYIAFVLKDGSMSYAYHIPGRTDLNNEKLELSGTFLNDLQDVSEEYAREYHYFDSSEAAGARNMNYWENSTEFYPYTNNFEVWDETSPLSGPIGSLQGLNVRHHHFPSNENDSFQTMHGNNITTEVSGGTSGTTTPMNGLIIMRAMYDGDGYHGTGWRGLRVRNIHPGSTLSNAIVTAHTSTSGSSGNTSSCGNGGSNGTTSFTASQPCTVITNYFALQERSCYTGGGSGCNSETYTRIRTNSSLTPESNATRQMDSCCHWTIGCGDSSANRTTSNGSVIQLLPGEKIWVESRCIANSRTRPGNTNDGVSCSSIDGWHADMYNPVPGFNPGWGTQTTHGSTVVFQVQAGPTGLNPDDILDAKISHNVKRLGFRLEDIKIPKSIADKIQGFRIFYANRDHTNKTILGQSTLNPMKTKLEIMGRCSEVVAAGNVDDGIQAMGQLGSLPEMFWSKDPWADDLANYTIYNLEDNENGFADMNGYKTFSFHDFTLLRTKNSIAAATHIKPIYLIRNLVWNGPGLEQERKMLSLLSGAGASSSDPAVIKEYWGWDVSTLEQNCYAREVHSAIFMGATHNNMKRGTNTYEYPRLLGQKAKLYLKGDSIFKGENLGFGGKIFNEFGESCLVFSLKSKHELPALFSRPDNNGSGNQLTHWGVDNPMTPALLLNPEVDWAVYGNGNHSRRAEQYLINLCSFRTDLYKSIDSQKLVWTGFEVLGNDLENYVFDDTTGGSWYGSATYGTVTTHSQGVWGGDTFICRYGYGSSITPNNESEESNPKKALYYQIVESQDNINFRHFESDLSLYFPGTPAKTILKYIGSDFQPGTTYDFTDSSEMKYNKNYSEVNDLRTAFPLPLREIKQTDFPTRTHRSAKADTTSLIDNWRLFLANNYKDLPKNRGELWKLSTFNNLLYFHMEESLFAAKGKQSMQMKDGTEAFIGSGDIFQQEPDELIQTKSGYGGTQSQWAAMTTRAGYFFVDRLSRKVFLMKDKLIDISLIGMESWFRENLKYILEEYGLVDIKDNPLTGFGLHSAWDPKYKRIILTKKEVVPTEAFITAFNSGNIRYNTDYHWFEIVVDSSGYGRIFWEDSYYFLRGGWTISYLTELNTWISFHSYIPYIYFNTSTNFYSLTDKYVDYVNGEIYSDGVVLYNSTFPASAIFTSHGMAAIWRHNERFKGLLYYDRHIEDAPKDNFEFEFIDNSVKTVDKVFYNISYTLQTFAYNADRNIHDINILHHGFTDYYIYNTHQVYATTAPYSTIAQPLEYLVNIRRIGNEWKINGFRDLAALAVISTAGGYYMSTNTNIIGGTNVGTLTTSPINKMFTINNIGNFYSEDLNFAYMDYTKTWDQRRKFTDKWAGIRLIYNNIENNLLNLYSTEVGARKYYR